MSQTEKKFIRSGNAILPRIQQKGSILDAVPAGLYYIKQDPFVGYYLECVSEGINTPNKIYGSTNARKDIILNAYNKGQQSLTVGLFGEKGAGKTLLANVVTQSVITDLNLPVIDVSKSFNTDSSYLDFIESLGDCAIIFDEFLKHLGNLQVSDGSSESENARKNQDKLLTFFQGTNNTKRLTFLIDNECRRLSEFFNNRPGRMRYRFDYSFIEEQVVEELATDRQLEQEKIDQLRTYSQKYRCTFDMINEVINEWVEYPEESLENLTQYLNVPTIRQYSTCKYVVTSIDASKNKRNFEIDSNVVTGNAEVIVLKGIADNPLYDPEHKYNDKDAYYDDINMSSNGDYERYIATRDKKRVPYSVDLSSYTLIGMVGKEYKHIKEDIKVTLEKLEDSSETFSGFWNF